MNVRNGITILGLAAASAAMGAEPADSLEDAVRDLDEFVLVKRPDSRRKLRGSAMNSELMTSAEIKRAACCNLGESFTTNPSVDVNYSDAATGARQIRLLGLPGTYVQMLTENIPNLRGASAPYGLSYIPGPWMQSIQVSKGASSVKNGYESVTGQINVEFLKPQTEQGLQLNAYADHLGKVEANASGNIHITDKLSTGLLVHGENAFTAHDMNDDGFADAPKIRQVGVMNRWGYFSDRYILQFGARYLGEKRESGQIGHAAMHTDTPYLVDVRTNRGEAWAKQAYIFDPEHGGNVALILSGSVHGQRNLYGRRTYDVDQRNLYASLMVERDFGSHHSLSAGLSFNTDAYNQRYRLGLGADAPIVPETLFEHENTPGVYAQYTYDLDKRLILMAGLRYDHSSLYGSMVTPRVHARYTLGSALSVHASAGKGYRTPFALADNSYLLASSREIVIERPLDQEEAWNFGGGLSGDFRLWGRKFSWGGEYYYTHFRHQAVVDLDRSPMAAYIMSLEGKSFSHAAQVELSVEPFEDFTAMVAYRYTDARVDYGRGVVQKPLTSRSKALVSLSYAPMMGLWQFDATLAVTGPGRMPDPGAEAPRWERTYKAFPTLNAQVTRNFRHWSVYIGGENLTNYRQKTPIIGASDPWGPTFDATMIYAPVHGAMAYIGFRYTL